MATVQVKVDTHYDLELSEDEALWLRDFLQNSRAPDESERSAGIRQEIFEELGEALTNQLGGHWREST